MDLIDRADVHDLIAKRLSDYLTDESREELEELDIKVEEDIPTVQAVPIEKIKTLINDIEVMRTNPAVIDNDNDDLDLFLYDVLFALNRLIEESDKE